MPLTKKELNRGLWIIINEKECLYPLVQKKIIRAIKHQKHEVIIGGEGVLAIKLKAFIPGLFRKLIRKQSAT